MGKIFPLKEKPSSIEATLKLIEKSFQYKKPNSFEIDFAPLFNSNNHHNCYIYVDENENVLAHVGAKEKNITINNKKFSITLLGGIAVDEAHRGEGIFQELFQDVLAEKRSDTTFFLLWSDLEKLYNKFGFHLCGNQIEVSSPKEVSPFMKTTYAKLIPEEQKQIQELYKNSFSKLYLTPERSETDWQEIALVTSSDLFVQKQQGLIESYYFQNKGQDLPNIIFEYGTKKELTAFLKEISSYGKLWLGKDILTSENLQYQFFMAPGDQRLFTEFVFEFTKKQFAIRNINLMKQEIYFDYNEETLSLEISDFLRGVFGPGTFEELEIPSIFISGLDSI